MNYTAHKDKRWNPYLRGRMYAEHAMIGRVFRLRVVVRRYELVVMLSPCEDRSPVGERIRHYGQSVAPRFHYGLHIVQ